jgi:hypothetical protein
MPLKERRKPANVASNPLLKKEVHTARPGNGRHGEEGYSPMGEISSVSNKKEEKGP